MPSIRSRSAQGSLSNHRYCILPGLVSTPMEGAIAAGSVTFNATNAGAIPHELFVINTDLVPDALPSVGGSVDVSQAGTQVAQISDAQLGVKKSASITGTSRQANTSSSATFPATTTQACTWDYRSSSRDSR